MSTDHPTRVVVVPLSTDERDALEAAAAELGKSAPEVARHAIALYCESYLRADAALKDETGEEHRV